MDALIAVIAIAAVVLILVFWVISMYNGLARARLRVKEAWFKADKPGYFYGQCAEYCGESHAIMKFRVIALSAADYVKWLDNQKQSARTVTAQSLAAEANVPHVSFASPFE